MDLLPRDVWETCILPHLSPRVCREVCREWRDDMDAWHDQEVLPKLRSMLEACRIRYEQRIPRRLVLRYHASLLASCTEDAQTQPPLRGYRCAKCMKHVHELGECYRCRRLSPCFPWERVFVGPLVILIIVTGSSCVLAGSR